jgi:hypothetical protein
MKGKQRGKCGGDWWLIKPQTGREERGDAEERKGRGPIGRQSARLAGAGGGSACVEAGEGAWGWGWSDSVGLLLWAGPT